jgi:hypothetical protein
LAVAEVVLEEYLRVEIVMAAAAAVVVESFKDGYLLLQQ